MLYALGKRLFVGTLVRVRLCQALHLMNISFGFVPILNIFISSTGKYFLLTQFIYFIQVAQWNLLTAFMAFKKIIEMYVPFVVFI